MDLALLRLATALADEGDLARAGAAAGGLGKRQAASRVAALEREVGALLFDHSGERVRLTPAGEAFVSDARLALAAAERAGRMARAVAERPHEIALGVTASALFGPVRDVVEDPAWTEAGLRPVLHEMRAGEQLQALSDGRLVAGFLTPPFAAPARLESRIVHSMGWAAVVPAADGHLRRSATLAGLARRPLVMIARETHPLLHDGLLAALAGTGQAPRVAQAASQWPTILAMVALGLGSALVPAAIARRLTMEGATALPLSGGESLPPFETAMLWLPQPAGSRGAEALALMTARFRG